MILHSGWEQAGPGEGGQGLREKRWHWDTLGSLESTWISGEGRTMQALLSSIFWFGGCHISFCWSTMTAGGCPLKGESWPGKLCSPGKGGGVGIYNSTMLSQDSSPFRCTGKVHQYGPILLGQVRNNSCWSEAEITSLERMYGHDVRDIVSRSNPVPFNVDYSQDNAEVFWKEGIIKPVHVSRSTWANTVDIVLKGQVSPSTAHLFNSDFEAKAWLLCLLVWWQIEWTPQTPAASACTLYPQSLETFGSCQNHKQKVLPVKAFSLTASLFIYFMRLY